jgi:molybdopterin-guanine dinucleotide biosynthesis protein A
MKAACLSCIPQAILDTMMNGLPAGFGTACVLAGGRGRRMEGLDKLRLDFAGERLLARIARQLSTRFSDLIAVSSRPEVFEDMDYRVVPDSYTEAGPLAGLHAGLRAARSEWVYLVACDMPFFSAGFVDALVARIGQEAGEAGLVAAAARSGDYFEPFHAFYHRSLLGPIEAAFRTSGRPPSMQSVVRSLPLAFLDDHAAFSNGHCLFLNVNTPAELAAAERLVSWPGVAGVASDSRGIQDL